MIAKLKAILSSIWADIVDTYKRIKIYFLGILAILAVIEWQKIKEALLAYGAQKDVSKAKKQDQTLSQQESAENQQANTLVQQANKLPSQEQPVTDVDWYKKDKK